MDFSSQQIVDYLVYYVVLLFSLSFHESAHAWMASRLGDQTARDLGRVSLNPLVHIDPVGTVLMPLMQVLAQGVPLLAWAKPTPVVARNFKPGMYRRGQVLTAGAGPVSNLILAAAFTIVLFVVARVGGSEGPWALVMDLLFAGVFVNVSLGIFNLVPLPPLDGSWVASFGLPPALGAAYDRIVKPYGSMILLLLVMTGTLGRFMSPLVRGLQQALLRFAVS